VITDCEVCWNELRERGYNLSRTKARNSPDAISPNERPPHRSGPLHRWERPDQASGEPPVTRNKPRSVSKANCSSRSRGWPDIGDVEDSALYAARVYVAGLSAGGAAAANMGEAYPDLYAAVGVHSGLACGVARDIPSAFAAMRQGGTTAPRRSGAQSGTETTDQIVATIVFHADRDTTVHPTNGDHVMAQVAASAGGRLRSTIERGQGPSGHGYTRIVCADATGSPVLEQWVIHGGGHAWSGGSANGSYTDPRRPDASREMLRFFLDHSHPAQRT
jgi:dienelactone hydrolase